VEVMIFFVTEERGLHGMSEEEWLDSTEEKRER
jgi:hypothetical protein